MDWQDPTGALGPRCTAIAAVGANQVIGDGHGLPWHLPEDFARFKAVTMGGVLVMGRRTYESLGGALGGRVTIVLTREAGWVPGRTGGNPVHVAHDVAQVGAWLGGYPARAWWSAGGGQVYRALWDYTTHLDVTEVKTSPPGVVTFPVIDPADWRLTGRDPRGQFDFATYQRRDDRARQALRALVGGHAG
jgi:dihydrofolate reductase